MNKKHNSEFTSPVNKALYDALYAVHNSHRKLAQSNDQTPVQPKQRRSKTEPFCVIDIKPPAGYWNQPALPEEDDFWPKDEYKPWIGRGKI